MTERQLTATTTISVGAALAAITHRTRDKLVSMATTPVEAALAAITHRTRDKLVSIATTPVGAALAATKDYAHNSDLQRRDRCSYEQSRKTSAAKTNVRARPAIAIAPVRSDDAAA